MFREHLGLLADEYNKPRDSVPLPPPRVSCNPEEFDVVEDSESGGLVEEEVCEVSEVVHQNSEVDEENIPDVHHQEDSHFGDDSNVTATTTTEVENKTETTDAKGAIVGNEGQSVEPSDQNGTAVRDSPIETTNTTEADVTVTSNETAQMKPTEATDNIETESTGTVESDEPTITPPEIPENKEPISDIEVPTIPCLTMVTEEPISVTQTKTSEEEEQISSETPPKTESIEIPDIPTLPAHKPALQINIPPTEENNNNNTAVNESPITEEEEVTVVEMEQVEALSPIDISTPTAHYASLRRKPRHETTTTTDDTTSHIGLEDPTCDEFYRRAWCDRAARNTEIYEHVFRCLPTDNVTSFEDLAEYRRLPRLAEKDPMGSRAMLDSVQGFLVVKPLNFLSNQNLVPETGSKESLVPVTVFT